MAKRKNQPLIDSDSDSSGSDSGSDLDAVSFWSLYMYTNKCEQKKSFFFLFWL